MAKVGSPPCLPVASCAAIHAGGSGTMISIGMKILLSGVLGIVFLAAAIPKLRHPRGFVLAVLEYRVLPTGLSWFYARLIPPLEFLLALLLLTGTAVLSAAIVTLLLLLSFIAAVGINLVRGRDL